MLKAKIYALILLIALVPIASCSNGKGDADTDSASPELVTRTLQVSGMTCDGCEGAIQDAVGELPGVVAVEANHETSRATVVYDVAAVSEKAITETIEELGYSVVGAG